MGERPVAGAAAAPRDGEVEGDNALQQGLALACAGRGPQ